MCCSRNGRPVTGSTAWFDRPEFAAFEEIWFVDFEFISRPGEHPDVLCLCAYELRAGRRIQLWEDQLGPAPPLLHGRPRTVRLLRRDRRMRLPSRTRLAAARARCSISSPMFRCYINGRVPPPEGKGLVGALRHFGLDTAGEKYKEAMRTRILQGRPYSAEEMAQILEYCMSDVVGLPALLERLLPARSTWTVCIALGRIRRGVGGDGAPRRSDQYGNRPPASGQRRVGLCARRHRAPDQPAIWRLCAGCRRELEFQHCVVRSVLRPRRHLMAPP